MLLNIFGPISNIWFFIFLVSKRSSCSAFKSDHLKLISLLCNLIEKFFWEKSKMTYYLYQMVQNKVLLNFNLLYNNMHLCSLKTTHPALLKNKIKQNSVYPVLHLWNHPFPHLWSNLIHGPLQHEGISFWIVYNLQFTILHPLR